MTTKDLAAIAAEYKSYKTLIEDAQRVADELGNKLRAYMEAQGAKSIILDDRKITYSTVTRPGLDSKKLKEDHPEIAKAYETSTTYMRLSVA